MNLSKLCIERPVLSIVISATIILFGLLTLVLLPIRFEPKQFKPTLRVMTAYPGASAEVIQNDITQKIVSSLSDVANIAYINAFSVDGQSFIKIKFNDISKADFVSAQADISRSISSVNLPENAQTPQLQQSGGGNTIILLGITDPHKTTAQTASYVESAITQDINQVPGVSGINLTAQTLAVRISLNPNKMAQYKLSPIDITSLLNKLNSSTAAGKLITQGGNITINLSSSFKTINDFKKVIVAKRNHRLIYLKDVADIGFGSATIPDDTSASIDGKPGVILEVEAADDANPMDVANLVLEKVQQINTSLPHDMNISVLMNLAKPLKQSIVEVVETILIAIILVALVSLLFLGQLRATIIPLVTIPVCLIGSFIFLYIKGYSIDMMTLLALVLAVGLVVDDAIVVLENVIRHIEKGLTEYKAALVGSKEIYFAIIGITITLIAVYFPIAFMSGPSAIYFQEFAFTLAISILISGFVALTLTPAMCAYLLRSKSQNKYQQGLEAFLKRLTRLYHKLLQRLFKRKWLWTVIMLIIIIFSGFFCHKLPSNLFPNDTIGIIQSYIKGPSSTSVETLQKKGDQIANDMTKTGYASHYGSITISQSGNLFNINFIILKAKYFDKAPLLVNKISQDIQKDSRFRGGAMAVPLHQSHSDPGSGDIQFYLTGVMSLEKLEDASLKVVDAIEKINAVQSADRNDSNLSPEYEISINDQKTSLLDVDLTQLQQALSIYFGSYQLDNDYRQNGIDYPVVIQLNKKNLSTFDALNKIHIESTNGTWVSVARLLDIKPIAKSSVIGTYNNQNAIEIDVTLKPGASMGPVINAIESVIPNVAPGTGIHFSGAAKDMKEGNQRMLMVFIVGIIFIYLVLAALFESFIDPFVIMLTVPLSVIGSLIGLKLIGGSINIYTGIGLVTLVGLITKHGVLIVQFANKRLSEGYSLIESAIAGASTRLRPILMTSATMILGALPLVLASGIGELARREIGMVIVSGLLIGSIFSLIIVPLAYSILGKFKHNSKY
ncbi:efflux RND transporter permease subunit [Thiotrichales bacterium 19S3-7]|nr:efflux RND transporter permease subunit [Thiotrichales bacterium 19S3-7]MCF6802528.1 efflux RND transporter permease subunit [Thiotrichales bacterium 19S3-11]